MNTENLVIKPKLRGEDGHRVISIRIKEDMVSSIDDIAARTGRSRNELIGIFLEFALEKCIVEDADE